MSHINRYIQTTQTTADYPAIQPSQEHRETKSSSHANQILSQEAPIMSVKQPRMVAPIEYDPAVNAAMAYVQATNVYALLIGDTIVAVDCLSSLDVSQVKQLQQMYVAQEFVEFHLNEETGTFTLKLSKNCEGRYQDQIGKEFCGPGQILRKVGKVEVLSDEEVAERLKNLEDLLKSLASKTSKAESPKQASVKHTSAKTRTSSPVKTHFAKQTVKAPKVQQGNAEKVKLALSIKTNSAKKKEKAMEKQRQRVEKETEIKKEEIQKADTRHEVKKKGDVQENLTDREIGKEVAKQQGEPTAKPLIAKPLS